jgi:DNA-binding response OmpR family regulator
MVQAHSKLRVLKFGVFEVALEAGELRKSGMLLKLVGQPFQVLQLLLQHPQEIVHAKNFDGASGLRTHSLTTIWLSRE